MNWVKMEKETGELKSHIQNASTYWKSEQSFDWRLRERGEVETFEET